MVSVRFFNEVFCIGSNLLGVLKDTEGFDLFFVGIILILLMLRNEIIRI